MTTPMPNAPTIPAAHADLLVLHAVPLLAAGLASALGVEPSIWPGPKDAADGADRPESLDAESPGRLLQRLLGREAPAVLVADLPLALAVLARARPLPGRPWRPWRCVAVLGGANGSDVRRALKHGVLGVVQADCSLQALQQAVAAARQGQHFLCSASAACMAASALHEPLTRREEEVLALLCQGLDNKSIAAQLAMALGTVKTHVKAILDKLDATSRTQAVAAAHRRGLVPPAAVHVADVARACEIAPAGGLQARTTGRPGLAVARAPAVPVLVSVATPLAASGR